MTDQSYAKDEQDLWIAQASKNVKKCAFYMRKAIDEDNMQEALRHSAAMLGELRTSLLGPQKYYQLYVQVNDELAALQAYFTEEPSKSRSFADLYELVQHAGNVLPRLYLLCTVGACYIRSREAPAKLLLHDMADMCKGVQHPTRGLFLRAYLVQSCRGLLPDVGSPYEGDESGDVVDAAEFLLANFTEMNKLWVRMKYQGGPRGTEQRERERGQLADLVGKNLTQLSQLEGLTFQLYRDIVLPRVLEQVVACKDELAQGYLMQCVAAVFPDDFHVGTLEALLGALPQLQPGVKLASVMGSLMERLAACATREQGIVAELDKVGAFGKLREAATRSVSEHPNMPGADLAAVYSGLLSFAGAVYPQRLDYVDEVLETCHQALAPRGVGTDARAERQLVTLLTTPVEKYGVLTVLGLEHFAPLLCLLSPGKRRDMARRIAETLVKSGDKVDSVDKVEILFKFLEPVVSGVEGLTLDSEDVAEDAALLAKTVHALRAEDLEMQYTILEMVLQKVLHTGGSVRAAAAIPPLFFIALQSVGRLAAATPESSSKDGAGPCTGCEKWYRYMHRAASALADAQAAELALQLFLSAALSSSQVARLELISYELFEQAFTLFEESIPDSKEEVRALQSIIGTLHRCRVFERENREALTYKATSYCSKLLKRTDQCLAVLACAHLYWQERGVEGIVQEEKKGKEEENEEEESGAGGKEENEEEEEEEQSGVLHAPVMDAKGVLSCLKRSLKIAHAAQQQLAVVERKGEAASAPGHLFVEILNSYVYFFGRGVESVTPDTIQSVLDLVASEVSSEACREDAPLQAFYRRTLAHLEQLKSGSGGGGVQDAAKYASLEI